MKIIRYGTYIKIFIGGQEIIISNDFELEIKKDDNEKVIIILESKQQ